MKNLWGKFSILIVFTSFISLTGCGPGFQVGGVDTPVYCMGSGCSESSSGGIEVPPGETPNKIEFEAEVDSVFVGKFKAVEFDDVNQEIIFQFPLPVNPIGIGFEEPIRGLEGARTSLELVGVNWMFRIYIPLSAIVKGVATAPHDRLPNGDSLPGIPGGELPSLGIHLLKKDWEANLYLGVEAMGVFVPTPGFDPRFPIQIPIKSKSNRKTIGYMSFVPEKRGYDGGVFFSFRFPDAIARAIDELL